MDKYISIKRTKMIDEAALGHKPRGMFVSIMIFLLVYIIATAIQGFITSVPTAIYVVGKTDYMNLILSFARGEMSQSDFLEGMNAIVEGVPSWLTLISLFAPAAVAATAIVYCKVIEKRKLSSMGIRKKGAVPEYLIGLLIGLVMFSLSFLIAWACKSVNIYFDPASVSPIIILYFIAFVVQGAAEELLLRGYFMVSLARDYSAAMAVFVSSIAFSLLHIGNTGVGILPIINIFLFGVFMAIYVFKRGDLLGACAIHTMWNFAQGNIFGASVSGMKLLPSIFRTESTADRVVANGGAFGLEGGVAVTIVLLIAIGVALVIKTKKTELSVTEEIAE